MIQGIILSIAISLFSALSVKGQTNTLPVIHINTENKKAITSKTVYIPGTYFIVDSKNSTMNIGSEESPLALEIRGRGHSSWKGDKKPYKIKLAEKAPLLGMKKNKHWALLKFNEATIVGLQLGKIMGMDWTPSTQPVEVILNDDYIGLYFLTETNRIGKNRLDIYEQPDRNEDESTIPYGWLVEVDNYIESNQIFIQETSKWKARITYHSPDTLSSAQKQWLINEFTAINTAIYDEDKTNSTWEQLVDVDAMARYFIIQEVLDNSDGFHGSFYLHKDMADDARWVAGPLWDLVCSQREKTDYTFRMKTSYAFTPHWIGELIKDEDFCYAVRNAWEEFYPHEIESWMEYIDEHLLPLDEAFEKEKTRWSYSNNATLEERTEKLKSSLLANVEWFNNNLPSVIPVAVNGLDMAHKKVVKVEYINLAGVRNSKPFKGLNVKETTYNDNSISTTKVIIKD